MAQCLLREPRDKINIPRTVIFQITFSHQRPIASFSALFRRRKLPAIAKASSFPDVRRAAYFVQSCSESAPSFGKLPGA